MGIAFAKYKCHVNPPPPPPSYTVISDQALLAITTLLITSDASLFHWLCVFTSHFLVYHY